MENTINIKSEYNTLDALNQQLKNTSGLEVSKEYDVWEHRIDSNGQMAQCIVLKKSAMHGMKIHFQDDNKLKMTYIIPNKMMHAYFGKSQKRYQNIVEIITGKIKELVLAPNQKKAFLELEDVVKKAVL